MTSLFACWARVEGHYAWNMRKWVISVDYKYPSIVIMHAIFRRNVTMGVLSNVFPRAKFLVTLLHYMCRYIYFNTKLRKWLL
jgi:hypothetical protein